MRRARLQAVNDLPKVTRLYESKRVAQLKKRNVRLRLLLIVGLVAAPKSACPNALDEAFFVIPVA